MPWLRVLIALLVTALVFVGVGSIPWMLSHDGQDLPSAPGISQTDAAALALPFEDLAAKRDDALIARMTDDIDQRQARQQLEQLRGLLPDADVQSSRLVLWRIIAGSGQQLVGVHEHTFPQHVVRTETVLARGSGTQAWRVQSFQMNVATKQELAANRPTLVGKPALTLAIIVAAAIMPFVCLLSFLAALFRKGLKHRWIWAIATIFGVGTFSVNVATGAWLFNPLSFQLFGASATWSGSAFDSWVFGVSLPLGALAFWTIGTRHPKPSADELIAEVRQELAAERQAPGQADQ